VVEELALAFQERGRAVLADGSRTVFDLYEAIVVWNGRHRRIVVGVVDANPLCGMGLLYGSELTVQVVDGGLVTIKPLSSP
jgi:predicted aspartyl protease